MTAGLTKNNYLQQRKNLIARRRGVCRPHSASLARRPRCRGSVRCDAVEVLHLAKLKNNSSFLQGFPLFPFFFLLRTSLFLLLFLPLLLLLLLFIFFAPSYFSLKYLDALRKYLAEASLEVYFWFLSRLFSSLNTQHLHPFQYKLQRSPQKSSLGMTLIHISSKAKNLPVDFRLHLSPQIYPFDLSSNRHALDPTDHTLHSTRMPLGNVDAAS